MIALGLGRGNELGDLTLNVSNVVVEPDEDDEEVDRIPDGEYVAITVRGAGAWDDDTWRAGQGPTTGLLSNVGPAADAAGAVYAYTRDLVAEGSVTVLLPSSARARRDPVDPVHVVPEALVVDLAVDPHADLLGHAA